MQLSPEMEARFAENRLKKFKIEHDLKNGFWAFLILGVIIFGSALFAGASSAMTDNKRGPMIFYTAFASGLFQILLGIGTIIAGTLNYRKIRIAGLIYLGIAVILLINRFMHIGESLAIFNIIFLLIAIGLSVWIQTVFNKEDLLKEEPGYPLFSPEASFAAKYEAPLHVRMAKASDHMETIGAPPAPAEAAAPAIPAVPESVLGNVPEVRLPNEVRLPSASDFGLSAELGSGSSTPSTASARAASPGSTHSPLARCSSGASDPNGLVTFSMKRVISSPIRSFASVSSESGYCSITLGLISVTNSIAIVVKIATLRPSAAERKSANATTTASIATSSSQAKSTLTAKPDVPDV